MTFSTYTFAARWKRDVIDVENLTLPPDAEVVVRASNYASAADAALNIVAGRGPVAPRLILKRAEQDGASA